MLFTTGRVMSSSRRTFQRLPELQSAAISREKQTRCRADSRVRAWPVDEQAASKPTVTRNTRAQTLHSNVGGSVFADAIRRCTSCKRERQTQERQQRARESRAGRMITEEKSRPGNAAIEGSRYGG